MFSAGGQGNAGSKPSFSFGSNATGGQGGFSFGGSTAAPNSGASTSAVGTGGGTGLFSGGFGTNSTQQQSQTQQPASGAPKNLFSLGNTSTPTFGSQPQGDDSSKKVMFGQPQTSSTTGTAPSVGAFGGGFTATPGNTSSKPVFGQQSISSPVTPAPGTTGASEAPKPMFGGATSGSTGGFSGFNASATKQPGQSIGGFSLDGAKKPEASSGFTLGVKKPEGSTEAKETPSFGGFGLASKAPAADSADQSKTENNKPSSGFSFGGAKTGDASKPLFGADSASKPSEPAKFGGFNLNANKPSDGGSKPLFGGAAATEPKTGGFSFGAKKDESAAEVPKTGGFSFGTKKDESKPEAPKTGGFSFGAKKDESTTEAPKTGGFSFGAKKDESTTEAPKTGGFSFGAKKDEPKPEEPKTGGFSFGAKKDEAKPEEPKTGGFSFGTKKDESKPDDKTTLDGTAAKPQSSAQKKEEPAKQKAEPIQPGTYIKNKSFEDIIAKWTSALSRNTSAFQAQAADIAAWDKVLVDNGETLTGLFRDVVAAEQSHAKINGLLEYISKQQDDLENLLEQYENDLSDMEVGSNSAAGMATADREREEAYKMAESLEERLDGMESNLSSVIKEINGVSDDMSKTNEDEPLTQIVKILNSHLTSLQWIDSSANRLQQELQQLEANGKEKIKF